jgi:hypothetical protein
LYNIFEGIYTATGKQSDIIYRYCITDCTRQDRVGLNLPQSHPIIVPDLLSGTAFNEMSGLPAQTLATHLINQTLSSLSVLETLNVISREDVSQIRSMLPNPYGPFPSLDSSLQTSFSQLSVQTASPPTHQPPLQSPSPQAPAPQHMSLVPSLPSRAPPREVRARALWDYSGTVSGLSRL